MPSARVTLLAVLLFVAGAQRAAAQAAPAPQGAPAVGCRGYTFSSSTDDLTGVHVVYPTLTLIQPGSPAALAGLQAGDSIVAVNGSETLAYEPDRDRPRAPGDTVVMTVRRGKADVTTRVVLGRRASPVPQETVGLCMPITKP